MAERANALIREKSPYLLQHAHNPVDWLPWGEAALTRAVAEDKPIFLSIGYSTCHWCHVMERESFEDEEVAKLLNETFVCVKVDREERPDLDSVYMLACQAMTGGGGWPLNILLTPQGRPFYAATYIPRESKFGRMGMLEFVPRAGEIWREKRAEAEKNANEVASSLAGAAANIARSGGTMPGVTELDEAYHRLSGHYDMTNGGFGDAPKFPSPHNLLFLLRYFKRTGEKPALYMAERTLMAMRLGGVFDQIGLGFHRYSTDVSWLLPHFEKMLYDQGMLALAYAEASQALASPVMAQTAKEVLSYVLRDLALPGGVFACGEDADSEGVEGKFYVWKSAEIREILSPQDAEFFLAAFHFEEMGNFEDEASRMRTGENIPHLAADLAKIAEERGIDPDDLDERLERILGQLFTAREKRVRPHRDDKALTDWNGLMVAALARAGFTFDDARMVAAAAEAATFLLTRMDDGAGGLYHRYRDGEAGIKGFCDDYAYLCWGLIELYQASFDPAWLEAAVRLAGAAVDRFWDSAGGGFYLSASDAEALFMRPKDAQDGAMPSGNSVAALNFVRLAVLTGSERHAQLAEKTIGAFSGLIKAMPAGFAHMLCALEAVTAGPVSIVIAAGKDGGEAQAMLDVLRGCYLPEAAVHLVTDANREALAKIAPYAAACQPVDGKVTAYVSRGGEAAVAFTDPGELTTYLNPAATG